MPISRSGKRGAAIKRRQRKGEAWHEGQPIEEYRPAKDKTEFIPRNQRNTTKDASGRLVNQEEVHDELRRLNP